MRQLLTKLRLGVLWLGIDKARCAGAGDPSHEDHLKFARCRCCDQDVAEDEVHFLFQCDLYARERGELVALLEKDEKFGVRVHEGRASLHELLAFCVSVWHSVISPAVGAYVQTIWQKRRDHLDQIST